MDVIAPENESEAIAIAQSREFIALATFAAEQQAGGADLVNLLRAIQLFPWFFKNAYTDAMREWERDPQAVG